MTAAALPGDLGLLGPGFFGLMAGTAAPAQQTFQVNASGKKLSFIFKARESFTLDAVAIRSSAVGTGGTYTVQVEGVDLTTGRADGVVNGSSPTLTTTTATPTTHVTTGLGATITKGSRYAVTYTWGSGDTTFVYGFGNALPGALPYGYSFDGVSTNTALVPSALAIGVGTGSTAWKNVPGLIGPATITSLTYTNSTNPDGRAVRIYFPVPVTIDGIIASVAGAATNGTFDINITDTSGTLLTSMTSSEDPENASSVTGRFRSYPMPADAALAKTTEYWAEIKATGSANVTFYYADYSDASMGDCLFSKEFYYGTRDNASGSFTPTTTRFPLIFPLISKLDDGAGAGGLAANPIGGFVG